MITADTITVPADEYRWLRSIYLESLKVRDLGVQMFNRYPPPMRLAIVSLALHYKDRGFSDRGTPKGALRCSRCGATVHQSWDHLSVGEHGERWTCAPNKGRP